MPLTAPACSSAQTRPILAFTELFPYSALTILPSAKEVEAAR